MDDAWSAFQVSSWYPQISNESQRVYLFSWFWHVFCTDGVSKQFHSTSLMLPCVLCYGYTVETVRYLNVCIETYMPPRLQLLVYFTVNTFLVRTLRDKSESLSVVINVVMIHMLNIDIRPATLNISSRSAVDIDLCPCYMKFWCGIFQCVFF